jgi:hypothetical protein
MRALERTVQMVVSYHELTVMSFRDIFPLAYNGY